MTKTSAKGLLIVMLAMVVLPTTALASNTEPTSIKLDKGQTIDGNYYAVANNVVIDGNITGDLICAGETVSVTGKVDGDIICAAKMLMIDGEVDGSVRGLALSANLNNKISRNVMLLAANLNFSPKTNVGMDVLFLADRVNFMGQVAGGFRGMANQVFLAGRVNEDVNLHLRDTQADRPYQSLTLTESGRIGGNLNYKARYDAAYKDRAQVGGKIVKSEMGGGMSGAAKAMTAMWIWWKVVMIISALIMGFLIMLFFRRSAISLADKMVSNFWPTIGWGAMLVYLLPCMAFFLAITIIALPVAAVVMMLWGLMVLVAKPLAAIMMGLVIMGRYRYKQPKNKKMSTEIANPFATMVIGVVATYTVLTIPIIGWLLSSILICWVVGAAWVMVKDLHFSGKDK